MTVLDTNLSESLWFTTDRDPEAEKIRLFCFHHSGGSGGHFRKWQQAFPKHIGVWAITLPGRWHRLNEPAFVRWEQLRQSIAELFHSYMDKPFAIFGYSLGATAAYDLARIAEHSWGMKPLHLAVCSSLSPSEPRNFLPFGTDDQLLEILVTRYGGLPKIVLENPEMLKLALPVIRSDFTLSRSYVHENFPSLNCPISAFMGRDDSTITVPQVDQWSREAAEFFTRAVLPGGHFVDEDRLLNTMISISRSW